MEILSRLGGGYNPSMQEATTGMIAKDAASYKPRTLTQQLDDQIAYHKSKIKDLQEAKDAITPDVERALNALQKL